MENNRPNISNQIKRELNELISEQRWDALRLRLMDLPDPDISDVLEDQDAQKRIVTLRLIPKERLSDVFSYLDTSFQYEILKELTDEETRTILAELSPDDRTEFLEKLSGQAIQKLMNLLNPEDRREALQLLGYPEESVGRLMTPDYVAVRPEWSVEQALKHIREIGIESEMVDVIYVTDQYWTLLDAMDLRRFILAEPHQQVEQIMDRTFVSVSALDDREKAVELIQHYDLVALPVVDARGVLLGIVTIDDLFDVAVEEATEDFQKSVAVEPLKMSYRESSIFSLYSKRVLWLITLLGISIVTTAIISSESDTLSSAIALVFFIPLLIGTGGNTGNQSATLMIRALSTGDIRKGQLAAAIVREIWIGILLGITMGLASWVLGIFQGGMQIALVVSLTMIIIVIFSSFLGIILPLILLQLRIDPAIASNPLIASVTDIFGLLIYFAVASAVIGIT